MIFFPHNELLEKCLAECNTPRFSGGAERRQTLKIPKTETTGRRVGLPLTLGSPQSRYLCWVRNDGGRGRWLRGRSLQKGARERAWRVDKLRYCIHKDSGDLCFQIKREREGEKERTSLQTLCLRSLFLQLWLSRFRISTYEYLY